MKKKSVFVFVFTAIFLIAAFVGFLTIDVDAAICKPKDIGGSCEGECCKLTKDGCIAGPCSVIL